MSAGNKENPIIAYGAAKFPSTGRGELSAPTTSLFRACCRHFQHVVLVDEFRTSKTCSICGGDLASVKLRGVIVRGLHWCGSTKCRRLLNRDYNAAVNILHRYGEYYSVCIYIYNGVLIYYCYTESTILSREPGSAGRAATRC